MPTPTARLVYVLDPMCSWCWAFSQPLTDWRSKHPEIPCEYKVGGLAPDSHQPMPLDMQQSIARIWHQIEAQTGASFNHDFWTLNTPRRSTYPACRAVIAAGNLLESGRELMSAEIQKSYYLQAKNPSDIDVLVDCALQIGLTPHDFLSNMESDQLQHQFAEELSSVSKLGIGGFPALLLLRGDQCDALSLGYSTAEKLELRYKRLVEHELS